MEHDIGTFLRARRAAVSPEARGLVVTGHRRVPGLRREETAQLAGVSVEYYVRIEQGRTPNVSDDVLDAIAGALGLSPAAREHLGTLARGRPISDVPRERWQVPQSVTNLLAAMDAIPAFVLGRRTDVLTYNAMADRVFGCGSWDGNAARFTFLDPRARRLHEDWNRLAADTVAFLSSAAGCHPDDESLATLIAELADADRTFAELWARHDVHEHHAGPVRVHHTAAGALDLEFQSLMVPGEPDIIMYTYVAATDQAAARLHALGRSSRAAA